MAAARKEYDAIIVGARVAGTAAAILLGRQQRKVLVLDRASFPSDAISTHMVLGGGAAVLERLGAAAELEKLGAYRFSRMRVQGDTFDYTGVMKDPGAKLARGLCLGRVAMDAAMVRFARSIDAVEVRERCNVNDLIIEDEGVVGVVADSSAGLVEFRAPLTIGADGIHSIVARVASEQLSAFPRTDTPCARTYYYGYWKGIRGAQLDEIMYTGMNAAGNGFAATRCEEGRTVIGLGFDANQMKSFRSDVAGNYRARLKEFKELGALLEDAELVSKIFSAGRLHNTHRLPVCDGALLLGDAGMHVDPMFAQGHSFALLSAEILAGCAAELFGARSGNYVDIGALANFSRKRDAALVPNYLATVQASRGLAMDQRTAAAVQAVSQNQWAADEMVSFNSLLLPPGTFPSAQMTQLMMSQTAPR